MPRSKRQPPVDERLLMSLNMTDFGPIADASVDLKPLTVFIGPNNSGKSYAALALRAALVATWRVTPDRMAEPPALGFLKAIARALNTCTEDGEVALPEEAVRAQTTRLLQRYAGTLGQNLERDLLCPAGELVRGGRTSLRFAVGMGSQALELATDQGGLGVAAWNGPSPGVKVRIPTKAGRHQMSGNVEGDDVILSLGSEFGVLRDAMANEAADEAMRLLPGSFFGEVGQRRCVYLPAGRTGIVQAHRALAASYILRAPYAGLEDPVAPRLPGGFADFIGLLLEMSSREGYLVDDARQLESDMIGGHILLDASRPYPEIMYEFDGGRIPLSQASSAVSELAPLFLYMAHQAMPWDVLICEEPEAHLHPQNQRNVARLLVRLVRRGVHVVITTHSEFLLEQLSHFVQLGGPLASERQKRYAYSEDDYLQADEVSVRLFKKKRTGGYGAKSIAVTQEEGIPQDEFLSISEEMYEETLKIERELAGGR
jgi:hypothetical protein